MTFHVSKMDLTTFLAQLVPILRVKLWKVVIRGKICFLIFRHFFSKGTFLRLWHFFLPSDYPINSIFSGSADYKIFVFDEALFLLTIRMPMITNFSGGDTLQGALTHIYEWHLKGVILWGHVTNKIHIPICRRLSIAH